MNINPLLKVVFFILFVVMGGGGLFLGVHNSQAADLEISTATISYNTIVLAFTTTLDQNSTPLAEDFTPQIDHNPIGILDVRISGGKVIIILEEVAEDRDVVTLTYQPGINPIQDEAAVDMAAGFEDMEIMFDAPPDITVEAEPGYGATVGSKLYVTNKQSASVSVIDTITNEVTDTITVGTQPELSVLVGNKLYVNNLGSNNVSVINTLTNTVTSTISVGVGPYFSTAVGTKVYVSNTGANTVSVINTLTDTVSATITVGSSPWYLGSVGTKVYVPNRTGNSVSVINTATDTVTATLSMTMSGSGSNVVPVGTKLYVGRGTSMAVINTVTDTVITNITVGSTPYFSCRVGTKVYVPNRGGSTVSVINTLTDTVTATLPVTSTPTTCVVIGTKVYITHGVETSTAVEVIDATTDTVLDTVAVGEKPFYATPVGDKLYVSNNASASVSVVDPAILLSELPNLTSFSTSAVDGVYTEGQDISITAHFGRLIQDGSTMTITLNSGAEVELTEVDERTLSGVYTIVEGEATPDLAVTNITGASVVDFYGHEGTSYELPSSQGELIAENSFITRNLGDSSNIVIGSYYGIEVGEKPYQVSAPITVNSIPYVYIANQGSDDVSVLRTTDNTVVTTIPVGSEPYGLAPITIADTTYIYVANTGSNSVSVINTSTNAVVATISVGVKPYYATVLGTNIYVSNSQSNTVSVINALTNTVAATVPVGSYPRGLKALGSSVYVANYGDPNYTGGNTISVINSGTNTVSATIIMPGTVDGPRGVNGSGTNLYVANFRSNNVSVIDTATNAVTATINVGLGPRGITPVGNKVYVENFDDGTMSVIDIDTNTVTDTLTVGHSPAGMGVSGTDIYYSRFQDNTLSKLNTSTNIIYSSDITAPTVTAFVLPGTANSLTVSVTSFTATDGVGVTGYFLSESSSTPSLSDGGWRSTAQATYIFSSAGTKTLYAWAKDEAGNISARASAVVTINLSSGGGGSVFFPTESHGADSPPLSDIETDTTTPSPISVPDSAIPVLPPFIATIAERIKSNLLLAVEDHGTLWYVDPLTNLRYPIQLPSALDFLRTVSLGISNLNLEKIPEVGETETTPNSELASRLQGRFLLQVENKGQTWYVDAQGYRHPVVPSNIIEVCKNFALGILNKNLSGIQIGNFK